MNVVIYARYSSHSQTEQSIEGQLPAMSMQKRMDILLSANISTGRRVEQQTAEQNFRG